MSLLPLEREGEPLHVLLVALIVTNVLIAYRSFGGHALTLAVVDCGDGPNRSRLRIGARVVHSQLQEDPELVQFHGRLSELVKQEQIAQSDVLVLPLDRSNEAFGDRAARSDGGFRLDRWLFDQPSFGDGLGRASAGLPWSQSPEGLAEVLQRLADKPALRQKLSAQSRERYRKLFARGVAQT